MGFCVQRPDRVRALRGKRFAASGISRCGHGIGEVRPRLPARRETGRHCQRTGRQARHLTGQIPLQDLLPGIASANASVLDVIYHRLGDSTGTVEEVQRDAVASAILVRPESVFYVTEDEPSLVDIGALAAAVREGQVCVKAPEPMVQPQHHAVGIDILEKVAIPRLDKAPADIDKIAAEFVVPIGGRHHDPVADDKQRRWR